MPSLSVHRKGPDGHESLLLLLVCIVYSSKMGLSQDSPETTYVIQSGSEFVFVLRDAIDSDIVQRGDKYTVI
jgi:hypothetical protein